MVDRLERMYPKGLCVYVALDSYRKGYIMDTGIVEGTVGELVLVRISSMGAPIVRCEEWALSYEPGNCGAMCDLLNNSVHE